MVYNVEDIMAKGRNTVVVVANLPRSAPELLIRMQTIVNAMEANVSTFPSPSPPLADVRLHITQLSDAQAAFNNHTGPSVTRDVALRLLMEDGKRLWAGVQEQASANVERAAVIAGQAAITLRSTPKRHKPPLAIKQTLTTQVKVIGKATKHAGQYGWEYSLDGGKTWIGVTPTTKATAIITGLQPGVMVTVRYRTLTTKGWGDWSDEVSHRVS
jgi:hypothetical protein